MAQSQRKGTPASGGVNKVFYVVLAVIALAGVAAIGYALAGGGGSAATEPIDLETADARALYDQATPIRLGANDAPVKIVEFGDFQCPGCGAFSLQQRPRVASLVDSGLVQFIYYDYPLGGSHVHSFLAARAARCAGEQTLAGEEDAYWVYHDKLYHEQATWSPERQVVDRFVDYAGEVGLDAREFERCLNSDRYADVVTANRLLGDQLGVRGTPTILVNNRRIGGRTIGDMGDQMIEVVRELLADEDTGSS